MSKTSKKEETKDQPLEEVLPKTGLVYSEKSMMIEILCKPKIMPIKSSALSRLEMLEKEANKTLAQGNNNNAPGGEQQHHQPSASGPGAGGGGGHGGAAYAGPGGLAPGAGGPVGPGQPPSAAGAGAPQQQIARPSSATGRPASAKRRGVN
jgi:hypothetical protein